MFLVHRGRFRMEFRDRVVELGPGEFVVVPHGTEHRPVADAEVVLLVHQALDQIVARHVLPVHEVFHQPVTGQRFLNFATGFHLPVRCGATHSSNSIRMIPDDG